MSKPLITAEELRTLVHYDANTGVFTWREDGTIATWTRKDAAHSNFGYYFLSIYGRTYPAGRLAWIYVHGVWPKKVIDHKNRVPCDNRIDNLREATTRQNCRNRSIASTNTTGVTGVVFSPFRPNKPWLAQIWIGREHRNPCKYIGRFKTFKEAVVARKAAEISHFESFAP